MNGFCEGTEVMDLGRKFQRDDSLLEKKFKDELFQFTSERTSSRIIQIYDLQYIPAVNIDKIVDQLIDYYKICIYIYNQLFHKVQNLK